MNTELTCLLVDDALAPEERTRIIHELNEAGFQAMAHHYPHGYRNNDRRVRDDASLAEALFDRLKHLLPRTLRGEDGAVWELVGFNERFRFCRYRGGQFFSRHQDGAFARSADERSLLTCMLYLNGCDEFEGGLTRYFEGNENIGDMKPRAGTAIVFDHRLWHEGQPVTRGTKYVMRTDVMYRRAPSSAADVTSRQAVDGWTARHVLRAHTGYIWALLPLANGQLASASRDGSVRFWASEAEEWRECAPPLCHAGSVTALVENEAGVLWTGTREGELRVLTNAGSREVARVGGAVLALSRVGNGEVACASADGTVSIFDSGGVRRASLKGHSDWVWGLARLGNGQLVSGSEDGTLRSWAPNEELRVETGAGVRALAASGDWLVAGLADGRVLLWNTARQWRLVADVRAHSGAVVSVAFRGEDAVASGGEDGLVRLSTLPKLAPCAQLTHGGFVRAIADLGERGLATGTYEGLIRIWARAADARW